MRVKPEIRDEVVTALKELHVLTKLPMSQLIRWTGVSRSKYYHWVSELGAPVQERKSIPRSHWLLLEERAAIVAYAKKHPGEGYRRLSYMMIDEDIVCASPSSTYRVLREAGLLNAWNSGENTKKGTGFEQPNAPHEHWHTDIKYVTFQGTFLFLISVIDGYSRFIVHHELRLSMQEYDVQITLERALARYPGCHPRMITDNGPQFIARDFTMYVRERGLQHVRTSIAYPQSNGKIERYHRTISEECLRQTSFIDLEDARRQVARYIEHYNTKRLHSALGYLTPEDVLLGKGKERVQQREQKMRAAAEQRRRSRCAA